jgi:hypothetical protein
VTFLALGISTAVTERVIVWLFIASGVVYMAAKAFLQNFMGLLPRQCFWGLALAHAGHPNQHLPRHCQRFA